MATTTSAPVAPERRAPTPLPGEDITTKHWEDARHWLAIYADLLRFKGVILDRVRAEIPKLLPIAQVAAETDIEIIRVQQRAYQDRIDLWYNRVWELRGLWLDDATRVVQHQGVQRTLSGREYQLLRFLVDNPHRTFTTADIVGRAWADHALFPEQARNYIGRLRRILLELGCPCEIISHRRRGYSLVFNDHKVA
ncbi:MAG: helix-turn-helix domain-containing protein [Candidatus Dormibacteria bacterium]